VSVPAISFGTDSDSGFYSGEGNDIYVTCGGGVTAQFLATGVRLKGTTTNDSASSGYIGEVIESVVTNQNAATSDQYGDLTSISLTAGDWLVSAITWCYPGVGGTMTAALMAITTTAGNSSTGVLDGNTYDNVPTGTISAGDGNTLTVPSVHKQYASTTTTYLKYKSTYSVGTPKWNGRITAVRIR